MVTASQPAYLVLRVHGGASGVRYDDALHRVSLLVGDRRGQRHVQQGMHRHRLPLSGNHHIGLGLY